MSEIIKNLDELNSLESLKKALKESQEYQKTLNTKIDKAVNNWPEVAKQQDKLQNLGNYIDILQTDASRLSNAVEFCLTIADSVSSKVRQLDLAKSRVFESIQRVDDILDLNYCTEGVHETMKQQNYEQAARHIHRYLCLDQQMLKNTQIENSDSISRSLKILEQSKHDLTSIIIEKFDKAVEKNNEADVVKYFKMFPLLKLHELGLEKFSSYLAKLIENDVSKKLDEIYAYDADNKKCISMYADALRKLLDSVANHVEQKQALVETYSGPGKVYNLLKSVQKKCDELAIGVIQRFKQNRHVAAFSKKVRDQLTKSNRVNYNSYNQELGGANSENPEKEVNPAHLQNLLFEMALMASSYEMYMGFIKRRARADIDIAFPTVEGNNYDLTEEDKLGNSSRVQLLQELEAWTSDCQLSIEMQNVVSDYVQFEEFTIRNKVENILKHDRLDESVLQQVIGGLKSDKEYSGYNTSYDINTDEYEPTPLIHESVDSIFFVLNQSLSRTLKTKSLQAACAIFNLCDTMLTTKLAPHIQKLIENGYPVPMDTLAETLGVPSNAYETIMGTYDGLASYGMTTSTTSISSPAHKLPKLESVDYRLQFLAACNNTEKIFINIEQLVAQISEQVQINFINTNAKKYDNLQACLKQMLQTAQTFENMQTNAIDRELCTKVQLNTLKPRIDSYRGINHVIDEETFHDYQANDPWVRPVLIVLKDQLDYFKRVLSITLYNRLVGQLVQWLARELESVIKKPKYNMYGAYQLESEVRKIMNLLMHASEKPIRNIFTKLQQTVKILNFERPDELMIYWGATESEMTWRLKESEIVGVMRQRVDFEEDAIVRTAKQIRTSY